MRRRHDTYRRASRRIRVLIGVGILLAAGCLSGCYVTTQARYFLGYQASAEKIDRLLQDETIQSETREFLLRVKDIKKFADRLGLEQNDNYSIYIDLNRDYIADVVAAAEATSLELYHWRFPIGSFPYKGYFKRHDAVREAERLKKKGYDVFVRRVDAFSTLGYFKDPLYSYMREYDTFRLASMLIHEQTHATIFLKENVGFNEELATFVGEQGALEYIESRYGVGSIEFQEAYAGMADSLRFIESMKTLANSLDSLYSSGISEEQMLREKERIISEHQHRFGATYEQHFDTDRYRWFTDFPVNNAFLGTYMMYTRELSLYQQTFHRCGDDLGEFIGRVKKVTDYEGDPRVFVASIETAD